MKITCLEDIWFSELHLLACLSVNEAVGCISGAFRHKDYVRFCTNGKGFVNLTCSKCTQIQHENDFTKKVVRKDHAMDKRNSRSIVSGRRIGYLTIAKFIYNGRGMRKKLKFEKLNHKVAKARIIQLKVQHPTSRRWSKNLQLSTI